MDRLVEALVLGPSESIEASEARGKEALLGSDLLPVEIQTRWIGDRLQSQEEARADFEALGFTFGVSDDRDELFAPAVLPTGWSRDGNSGHSMWSYLVDDEGTRRVEIFYKAAFYDRRAFMRLADVA